MPSTLGLAGNPCRLFYKTKHKSRGSSLSLLVQSFLVQYLPQQALGLNWSFQGSQPHLCLQVISIVIFSNCWRERIEALPCKYSVQRWGLVQKHQGSWLAERRRARIQSRQYKWQEGFPEHPNIDWFFYLERAAFKDWNSWRLLVLFHNKSTYSRLLRMSVLGWCRRAGGRRRFWRTSYSRRLWNPTDNTGIFYETPSPSHQMPSQIVQGLHEWNWNGLRRLAALKSVWELRLLNQLLSFIQPPPHELSQSE